MVYINARLYIQQSNQYTILYTYNDIYIYIYIHTYIYIYMYIDQSLHSPAPKVAKARHAVGGLRQQLRLGLRRQLRLRPGGLRSAEPTAAGAALRNDQWWSPGGKSTTKPWWNYEFMGFYGFFMVFYGFLWDLMGFLWDFMVFNGILSGIWMGIFHGIWWFVVWDGVLDVFLVRKLMIWNPRNHVRIWQWDIGSNQQWGFGLCESLGSGYFRTNSCLAINRNMSI